MVTEIKWLKDIPCFQGFSNQELSAFAEVSKAICYPPGHVLTVQGEPGTCFFLINQGSVDFVYKGANEKKVGTLFQGEIVGISALIPPYQYAASIKCRTDVDVLEINIKELLIMIEEDKVLGLKLQACLIELLVQYIHRLRTQ